MSRRTEKWIARLIAGLDEHVDEKTRAVILEQCGRQCQSESSVRKAKAIYENSENIDDFLRRLGQKYKHLHIEGNNVHFIYPKCLCSQVNKIPKGKLSGTYCACSIGWTKALFEGALGKPVEVIMEKSIISGDDECRFKIVI